MNKSKVMLVDDHNLVRAGIKGLINQLADFEVSWEARSVAEALAILDTASPDVLITDIGMGDQSGLDLIGALKRLGRLMPVLVLSMHSNETYVSRALAAGACGYVVKDGAPAELALALGCAARGDCYLSAEWTGKMARWSVQQAACGDRELTARQRQILGMIGASKNTKQIAFELKLSEKTVAAHRAEIMTRVGIRDRVGLALFALRRGFVSDC